jgi:hypothetical protein
VPNGLCSGPAGARSGAVGRGGSRRCSSIWTGSR